MIKGSASWAVQAARSEAISAPFLKAKPGYRQPALGGEQVADSGSVEGIFSNPASLVNLPRPVLQLHHTDSFLDVGYFSALYALPLKKRTFGVGLQYNDLGEVEVTRDRGIVGIPRPTKTGETVKPYTAVSHFAWSEHLHPRLSLGYSLKGWHQELDETSNSGLASDFGLLFTDFLPHINLGLAYKNVGAKVDGNSLPTSGAVGFAKHFHTSWLKPFHVFGEYDFSDHRDDLMRTGVEFRTKYYGLLFGYNRPIEGQSRESGRFSFGGNVNVGFLKVGYAWEDHEDLGDQQQFVVSFGFGLTAEQRRDAEAKLNRAVARRMKDRSLRHLEAAKMAEEKKEYEKAISELTQALSWDSSNKKISDKLNELKEDHENSQVTTFVAAGNNFMSQKRWIDAAFQYQEALKINPEHELSKTKLNEARSNINTSLTSTSGNSINKTFERGVEFYIKGQFKSALMEWSKVVKKKPNWPSIQEYMAKANAEFYKQKLEKQNKVSSKNTNLVESLNQKAYTYYSMGSPKKALQTWNRVLAIDPKNPDASWGVKNINQSNLADGNGNGSQKHVVVELNMEALNEYSTGNLSQAVKIWRRALKLDPNNIKIQNNLNRVTQELALKGDVQ